MSKLTRREFLRRSSLLVGASLLAACAAPAAPAAAPQSAGSGEAAPAPSQEAYEFRVHTRAGADLDAYYLTVLDQFKEIVPLAEVKIEAIPGGALEYAAKMLVLMAGDQIGDTIWSASRAGFNRRFMGVRMLEPLDAFIEGEDFDLAQYYPNCIAEAQYEGNLMALPHISEPGNIGLMMNLDLFEQAGAEPLDFNSSMEDLIAAGEKLTSDGNSDGVMDVFGFARNVDYFNWVTHVRSFGGDFLNAEGTQCLLDSPEALAAFQQLYDVVYVHNISPSPAQVADGVTSMFQGGSLATMSGWPIHASQWPTVITDFKVGSTIVPNGPAGHGSMLNQHMMSVAAASKHKEAAWEWVKWTCSAEFSKTRALQGLGGPVGMPSVWHDEELLTSFPAWREWADIMDNVGPNYNAANLRGKEVEDAFNQGISAIMVQDITVEEGLLKIKDDVQEILDKSVAT